MIPEIWVMGALWWGITFKRITNKAHPPWNFCYPGGHSLDSQDSYLFSYITSNIHSWEVLLVYRSLTVLMVWIVRLLGLYTEQP